MIDPIADAVCAALNRRCAGGALGLAVSGGGDSMALLIMASNWAARTGALLFVATVDHGLRPESGDEARVVAASAANLGLPHRTLVWDGWDGRGNLQAAARAARRRLLAAWARENDLSAVVLGHTLDDQAETVLMRLARSAGVDGLSAMTEETETEGVRWLRPMLGTRREALRDWLKARGERWIDDPSNENERFDRVKARRAITTLRDLGVTAEGLAGVAERMREAREALNRAAADLAASAARWGRCGELRLALAPLREAPPELARRLLRAGLRRAAGAAYGPRGAAERRLLSSMLSLRLGGGRSLNGCLIRPDGAGHVVICREAAASPQTLTPPPEEGALWDGRFRLGVDGAGCAKVGALGLHGAWRLKKLAASGEWRPPASWRAAPAAARLTTPALWRGGDLAAAPLAGYGGALTAEFVWSGAHWGDV